MRPIRASTSLSLWTIPLHAWNVYVDFSIDLPRHTHTSGHYAKYARVCVQVWAVDASNAAGGRTEWTWFADEWAFTGLPAWNICALITDGLQWATPILQVYTISVLYLGRAKEQCRRWPFKLSLKIFNSMQVLLICNNLQYRMFLGWPLREILGDALELLSMGRPRKDISTQNLPVVSHLGNVWEFPSGGPPTDIPGTCIMRSGTSGRYWVILGSWLCYLGKDGFA